MTLSVLIPLIVAVVTSLGAYFAAARRLSGTVRTSTAEDLWAESSRMREDLQKRVTELETLVDRMQVRIDTLLDENVQLHQEAAGLRMAVARLERGMRNGD